MSDLDVMRTISDDLFLKIAAHMQLQKSVAAFALVTMNRRPIQDSISPEPTRSKAEPAEDVLAASPQNPETSASGVPTDPSSLTVGTLLERIPKPVARQISNLLQAVVSESALLLLGLSGVSGSNVTTACSA
jgi:hypothetical protein